MATRKKLSPKVEKVMKKTDESPDIERNVVWDGDNSQEIPQNPEFTVQITSEESRKALVQLLEADFHIGDRKQWTYNEYSRKFPGMQGLTSLEKDVIQDYIDEIGFRDILNSSIKTPGFNEEDVASMDSAINKSEGISTRLTVYKGIQVDFHDIIDRKLRVGETFMDLGFASVALKPDAVTNLMWKNNSETNMLEFGTIFKIDLPVGTKVLAINSSDFELLLPREMEFEVLENMIIDIREKRDLVPRRIFEYLKMLEMKMGGVVPEDASKMRLLYLRALPNDNQLTKDFYSKKIRPRGQF